MSEKHEIVTDDQIDAVWGNADFGGSMTKREVVDSIVLKCASGYSTGFTAGCIARELKLIHPKRWGLTRKGKKYLYEAFVMIRGF